MRLSAEQTAAMTRPSADAFEPRARAFLLRACPALASDPDRLAGLVANGLARAPLNGFASERNIVLGLLVALRLGPGFDTDPAYAAPPGASAETRLRGLLASADCRPEPELAAPVDELAARVIAEFSNAAPGEPVRACAPEEPEPT